MKTKITFTLPAEGVAGATDALLLGDFNGWNPDEAVVMKKQKDGSLKATLPLETGRSYQYRYLLNDGRWENDYNAQQYVYADGFFVDNCLITVPEKVAAVKKAKSVKSPATKTAKSKSSKTAKAKDGKPSAPKAKTSKPKTTKAKKENDEV